MIARRVKRGALIRQFRGVYAVGHEALTFRARCIAALLAVGDDAALSHETAAHLRTFLPTQPPFIDVTVARPATAEPARADRAWRRRRCRRGTTGC